MKNMVKWYDLEGTALDSVAVPAQHKQWLLKIKSITSKNKTNKTDTEALRLLAGRVSNRIFMLNADMVDIPRGYSFVSIREMEDIAVSYQSYRRRNPAIRLMELNLWED